MKRKIICCLIFAALAAASISGCAAQGGDPVTVQPVSMITGAGSVGLIDRFAGVVSARSEVEIEKDPDRTISEIMVQQGQEVKAGQILFAYDIEESQLALEKAQLEEQRIVDTIAGLEKQKAELEEDREDARKEADKLSYTLEIQTCETDIREANYNLVLQQKEVERLQAAVEGYEITCPIDGRVQTVNKDGGFDDYGNALPFMTIMEAGEYRVKGNVDESNAYTMVEGTPVIVRSRVDDNLIWHGTLAYIDWQNPVTNNNRYYYVESDEMVASNKYPFYIELDSAEGLLLGQHVYIEPDKGQNDAPAGLMLPAWYLVDIDGATACVWARGSGDRLEKRTVTLGVYDEMLDQYEITGGLGLDDYIAFPAEGLEEGMPTTEFDESAVESGAGADDMASSIVTGEVIADEGFVDESFVDEGFVEEGAVDEGTGAAGVTADDGLDTGDTAEPAITPDGGTVAEGGAE